jgi:hypothetical protein
MTADHARYDELAVGWALHALEPADEAAFLAHLADCERCAATVADTHEVMSAMATDLPRSEPSEGLRHRIRAAVEQTEQSPAPGPETAAAAVRRPDVAPEQRRSVEPRSRPRRALLSGLVAAGVAVVVGLGVWNVVLNEQRQDLQATVAEQSEVVDGLLTPGQATIAALEADGRSVATVVARGDEVQVVSHGLSVNDAGSTTYVLWGLEDGTATALGTFDVTSARMDERTVGSGTTGADGFASYGISLEPGQDAPSAPTEVVATGQVTS